MTSWGSMVDHVAQTAPEAVAVLVVGAVWLVATWAACAAWDALVRAVRR